MTALRPALLACILWVCSTIAALAVCLPPQEVTEELLNERFGTIGTAQRALRTALQSDDPLLRDGNIGGPNSVTRNAFSQLCAAVPQPAGRNLTTATLDVMQEYLDLSTALASWPGRPFNRNVGDGVTGLAARAAALALAMGPEVTARALRRNETAFDCTQASTAIAGSPEAMRAMQTLVRLFAVPTEAQICGLFSMPADPAVFREGLARLDALNTLRPRALATLMSPEFIAWVNADRTPRLRRLLATEPAIATLLDDYATQAAPQPGATAYTGSGCSPDRREVTGTYYSLTAADIANIKLLISLTPVLQGFAKDTPGADSAGALWRDLAPVLEAELGDCVLPDIEPLVLGPDTLPKTYGFKPNAVLALSGMAELEPSKAVLAEYAPQTAATKAEFLDGLKAAMTAARTGQVAEVVEQAAETMAAAAETTPALTDTARVEIPEEDQLAAATAPQITVTEAADEAVQSVIDNPLLTDALALARINPAPVPEQIKAQVRNVLRPTANAEVARSVEAQIALVEPFVTASWGLSPPLIDAITALPYVHAAMTDSTGMALPDRLESLAGVAYPTQRLFREALMSVSAETGPQPFSPFVIERIVQAAKKEAESPDVPRVYGPLAEEGCDCVAERGDEYLKVYGFYPFWNAPLPTDRLPEGAKPEPLKTVDFGLVSDVAFYGLEFVYETPPDGEARIVLRNKDQWRAARRDFVNSAHQFRARADLAFDMRDWPDWNDRAVDRVIDLIIEEVAPFSKIPSYTLTNVKRAIPTLFDHAQPDGVTLIFPLDEEKDLTSADMAKMVAVIEGLYNKLPHRDRVHINVAFDFPLMSKDINQPLFDDLFGLLIESPRVVSDSPDGDPTMLSRENTQVIKKVLLFLERPTTDAKKGLRERMDQGLFQGPNRERLLRSIIPVLPPAGHRLIKQRLKVNAVASDPPGEFSQFEDDIIYFEDNFSGVGFWPVPDTASPEITDITRIVASVFNTDPWARPFTGLQARADAVCNVVCPNRAAILLATLAAFAAMLVLVRTAFYVGWAEIIAYRMFYLCGLVLPVNLVILIALFLLWVCDHQGTVAVYLFWVFVVLLGLLTVFNSYQRIRNGRTP
jgi:hypothetical protein